MLSAEFHDFHNNWLQKANHYNQDDLHELFDTFFTLFVIYNRLYAEATFVLARRGGISIANRTAFPDSSAAKSYVLQYLGAKNYVEGLIGDPDCQQAINSIVVLIDQGVFPIKLDMIHGTPQRGLDLDLRRDLQSHVAGEKGRAVLDLLYSIRCNLFHGHKGFEPIQSLLLTPTIVLLRKTIEVLFVKLDQDPP